MTQDQVVYGVTVRALIAFDDIPAGTLATMTRFALMRANGAFRSVGNAFEPKAAALIVTSSRLHTSRSLSWRIMGLTVRNRMCGVTLHC